MVVLIYLISKDEGIGFGNQSLRHTLYHLLISSVQWIYRNRQAAQSLEDQCR
jgi:hypothetical protein